MTSVGILTESRPDPWITWIDLIKKNIQRYLGYILLYTHHQGAYFELTCAYWYMYMYMSSTCTSSFLVSLISLHMDVNPRPRNKYSFCVYPMHACSLPLSIERVESKEARYTLHFDNRQAVREHTLIRMCVGVHLLVDCVQASRISVTTTMRMKVFREWIYVR